MIKKASIENLDEVDLIMKEIKEEMRKENNIKILKSDTEISNAKMNDLFIKEGYKYIGRFSYNDYPGIYNYYEKEI